MREKRKKAVTTRWLPLRPPRPVVNPRQEAARRVRPLLRLLGVDLARLSAREWRGAEQWLGIYSLVGARVPAFPRSRAGWQRVLDRLAEILAGLVRGTPQEFRLTSLSVRVEPRTVHDRREWQKTVKAGTAATLADALALAVVDDVTTAGVEKLKRCQFREAPHQPVCGRLFLAQKRQTWCSPEHRVRAAYLDWKRRGGPRHTPSESAPDRPREERRPESDLSPEAVAQRAARALARFARRHGGRTPGELAVERQIVHERQGVSERGRRPGSRQKGATS